MEPADEELHGLVEQRLRSVEQRYTWGRRVMVELLSGAGRPVSIADIIASRPDLARSSAYRHLTDLQLAGVVRRLTADDEFARFELAEDLTEHHHHLLCVRCGAVTDVSPSRTLERAIGRALSDLAHAEGFDISSHRLDALGVCRDCH